MTQAGSLSPDEPSRSVRALLIIRKLIFRHDTLYLVGLDTVPKASVRLDRHTLNDGVNLPHLDIHPPLRPLSAMEDFVVQLVSM